MSDAAKFTLHIDGMMPDDLSLRRLAGYLDLVARLLGEEDSTRFDGVYPGSACLTVSTFPVAVPKVRARLAAARDGAQPDARRLVNRLDDMLAQDNASGSLSEDGQPGIIIRFPGAHAAHLPTVTEISSIQGELVRIGGRDDTAHATLRAGDRFMNCEVTKDIARALGKHLFGQPLRLSGRGRWRRTRDGTWELEDFRANDFQVLDAASLREAAARMRAAGGFGVEPQTAWDMLRELRED